MTPLEAIQTLEQEYSDERIYTYRRFNEDIRNNVQVFHRLLDLIDPEDACGALYSASNEIKNNFDAALRACQCTIESFEDVSLDLRQNAAFVFKVFSHKHPPERQFVGYEGCIGSNLLNDRDFVLEFVNVRPSVLKYAPAFQNDLEIVSAALQRDGAMLQFVRQELRTRDVVEKATANQPLALKFAGAFCDDKGLVGACVCRDGAALQFASTMLQQDKDVVYEATKQTFKAAFWVHAAAETHMFETCQAIIAKNAFNLQYINSDMMTRDLVLAAVERDGMALKHAGIFKSDKEVVCRAVSNNHAAMMHADKSVVIDADVKALYEAAKMRTGGEVTYFKPRSEPFSMFSMDFNLRRRSKF